MTLSEHISTLYLISHPIPVASFLDPSVLSTDWQLKGSEAKRPLHPGLLHNVTRSGCSLKPNQYGMEGCRKLERPASTVSDEFRVFGTYNSTTIAHTKEYQRENNHLKSQPTLSFLLCCDKLI